jgi:very-short-patch-repair endonuclease
MAAIDHAAIAERAAPQLGLITTPDLRALGLTGRQIDRVLGNGVLRRIGRGVHALAGAPTSPRQRLLAATLLAGEGAVASHLAAAWVWGFDGIHPDEIELSVPRARNPRGVPGRVHRVSDLLPVDVTLLGPQPITTPARTLLDIAARIPASSLEEAFDGARRRGQIYLPFLEWRLAELRRHGRAGIAAVEDLVRREHTSERAESWLESAFLRIVRDAFLPPPRVQVVKQPSPGGPRLRLDAFYDDQHLVAEVNGHGSHATRRQRQADAERRARLVAMGLRVVDFTYEDVAERPLHVTGTLETLLGLVAWRGSGNA